MPLFHASRVEHSRGTVVSPNRATRTFGARKERVEDLLEALRPEGYCSRVSSVFACLSAADAARYLQAEVDRNLEPEASVHVFEVEGDVEMKSKHPMALVDYLGDLVSDAPMAEAMAKEYWNPTFSWEYWEVLCPALTVVRLVEGIDSIDIDGALSRYWSDKEQCKQHWPKD